MKTHRVRKKQNFMFRQKVRITMLFFKFLNSKPFFRALFKNIVKFKIGNKFLDLVKIL